jgi:hypothetical protein
MSPDGKKVSEIDFSRWVPPNTWKTFEILDKNLLYIPELMEEYDLFWENGIVHSYVKEDLQYGFRPIDIDFHITLVGGGRGSRILLDKENGNIYDLGRGIYRYDYIEDFKSYKKGKKTELNWKNPHYLYKNKK